MVLDRLIAEFGQQESTFDDVPGTETGFVEIVFSLITQAGSVGCEVELVPSQVSDF